MSLPELYTLQWRGTTKGPLTLGAIKNALAAGEIHSLYQIHTQTGWQPLRDFLAQIPEAPIPPSVTAPTAEQLARDARLDAELRIRREYDDKLQTLEGQIEEERQRRREMSFQNHPPSSPASFGYGGPLMPAETGRHRPARTSGLAIASFVLSLLFFIPGINLITWILSLVFGHVALGNINQNPTMGGRGLAIAGLVISYVVIGLGILVLILIPSLYRPFIDR